MVSRRPPPAGPYGTVPTGRPELLEPQPDPVIRSLQKSPEEPVHSPSEFSPDWTRPSIWPQSVFFSEKSLANISANDI